jgi:hypothetical protein
LTHVALFLPVLSAAFAEVVGAAVVAVAEGVTVALGVWDGDWASVGLGVVEACDDDPHPVATPTAATASASAAKIPLRAR